MDQQQLRQEQHERRAFAAWVQQRTGVRQLEMLRRIARNEPAAAAVIAAIDKRTIEAVREARGEATPQQVARRLTDLCCVWAGPGIGGIHCVELSTGDRAVHPDIETAALWCVRMIPAGS